MSDNPIGELALAFVAGGNANTLEGHAASYFLTNGIYTAADVLAKIKSFSVAEAALDVLTVAASGIGTASFNKTTGDPDTITVNGNYYYDGTQATGKVPFAGVGWLITHEQSPVSTNLGFQFAKHAGAGSAYCYFREKNVTWGPWARVRTSANDLLGTSGLPSPRSEISMDGLGSTKSVWGVAGTTIRFGFNTSGNVTGTWIMVIHTQDAGNGAVTSYDQVIGAGGAIAYTVPAGKIYFGETKKIANAAP